MALLVFCSELHLFAKALGARRQLVECRGSAWHGCRDATLLYAEALGVVPQIENIVRGLHRGQLLGGSASGLIHFCVADVLPRSVSCLPSAS